MSHLSELSIQLRKLQHQNKTKDVEIDKLHRQILILSELQGVSVNDLKDALKTACEREAHNELRAEVGKLKNQLECWNDSAEGPNQMRGGNLGHKMRGKTEEKFDSEIAARTRTRLELRIGELEELEAALRSELSSIYEKSQALTSRNTELITRNLHLQADISEWERRWLAREDEEIRNKSIVLIPSPSRGSYNYSEFSTNNLGLSPTVPPPILLLKDEPQSQLDLQQRLLIAETSLTGISEQRSLLQTQMESLQKSSQLKHDQFQARLQFQEDQIFDLEQQLSSLYAAFGIFQGERIEESDQKLRLKRLLLDIDAEIAIKADEDERKLGSYSVRKDHIPEYESNFRQRSSMSVAPNTTSAQLVSSVRPSVHKPIVEGYLLLLIDRQNASSPVSTKTKLLHSSSFSPQKFLQRAKSASHIFDSTPASIKVIQKFKKRYCVLHGLNGLYQLRYGASCYAEVEGVLEFITTGVSSIEHTHRSSLKEYGFEIVINPKDKDSPSLCCAAESETDFTTWMTALTFIIGGDQMTEELSATSF